MCGQTPSGSWLTIAATALSAGAKGRDLRISVEREAWFFCHLHDNIQEGATLDAFRRQAAFTLRSGDKSIVLISGAHLRCH